jgi:hypothetical protein
MAETSVATLLNRLWSKLIDAESIIDTGIERLRDKSIGMKVKGKVVDDTKNVCKKKLENVSREIAKTLDMLEDVKEKIVIYKDVQRPAYTIIKKKKVKK